ncbi:MAG TPA: hypothetical protein VJ746_07640 [Nitrospira sp.]|nr:hypothetical protein [Nitrospira sp.]
MTRRKKRIGWTVLCLMSTAILLNLAFAEDRGQSSYMPVDIKETFASIMTRMKAAKPEIMRRQVTLLEERYDLGNRPSKDVTMSRGKPIQEGIRVNSLRE